MDSENFVPPAPEPQPGSGPEPPQFAGGENASHQNRQGQGRRNRRRRGRRNGKPHHKDRHAHGRPEPGNGQRNGQQRHGQGNAAGGVFTAPMDHSYRRQSQGDVDGNSIGGGFNHGRSQKRRFGRGGFRQDYGARPGMPPAAFGGPHIEPVPAQADGPTRVFAFVEDLFFVTKMNETARKLNVKLEFVKSFEELMEKTRDGEDKPSLVVVDLNSANLRPLTVIPKLRSAFKKSTSVLGFVSHVQGELKLKAQEAGCDSVMPRSAFSQNLPQILRRHGAPEEIE